MIHKNRKCPLISIYITLLFCIFTGIKYSPIFAAPDETEQYKSTDTDTDRETIQGEDSPDRKLWQVGGYCEVETFIMYNRGLAVKDYKLLSGSPARVPRNEYMINKAETHTRLDLSIGTETIKARTVIHGYLYPGPRADGGLKNRVAPNEAYLTWTTDHSKVDIGRKIIRWGTADYLNPTAFFMPYDFEEFLFKDTDELYRGTTALSTRFFFKDFSLQLVCAPLFTPTLLPRRGSPWSPRYPDINSVVPVEYLYRKPNTSPRGANVSYGGRLSGTLSSLDFSISAYHGPDREPLLVPTFTFYDTMLPSGVYLIPKFRSLTAFGMDLSFAVSEVMFQAEAAYSYNKSAVTAASLKKLSFPTIRDTHYLNISAGLTWLREGSDFTLLIEGNKSLYLVKPSRYMDPYISDFIITRIEKKCRSGSILLRLQAIVGIRKFDFLIMPALGYDFQNGLSVEIEGAVFEGARDTLFGSYDSRDIIKGKVKYSF